MLETAQNIDMFIPMMVTIMTAFATAQVFNKSLYMRALRTKQVPFLTHKVPKENRAMRAKVVMSRPVITLTTIATVEDIFSALKEQKAYFPVLNQAGILVGRISSNFLIKLIECKCWYDAAAGGRRPEQADSDGEDLDPQGAVDGGPDLAFPAGEAPRGEVERGVSDDELEVPDDNAGGATVGRQRPVSGRIEGFLQQRHAAENAQERLRVERTLPTLMGEAARAELAASEYDQRAHPIRSVSTIDWRNFNTDMYSTDRSYTEIADVADNNLDK